MLKNEKEVITRAKTDLKLQEEIVNEYTHLIYHFIGKYKYSLHMYEECDLVDEARIAIMHAINDFDPKQKTKFFTFVYTYISRRFIKMYRYEKVKKRCFQIVGYYDGTWERSEIAFAQILSETSQVEYQIENKIIRTKLIDYALKRFKDEELEIFFYLLEGFKARQIAQMLGRNEKWTANKVYRIKQKIKRNITLTDLIK
ncbi:MAG: RNA polymerase sigma factor [Mycoplasmatales bacterium]